MNERKSFVLYLEYAEYLDELTDEEVGRLTRAIFDYNIYGEEPESFTGALKLAWIAIRQGMDRNNDRYERRASAGKRGGRPRKDADETQQDATEAQQARHPERAEGESKDPTPSADEKANESKNINAFECFSDEKANESKETNAFLSDGVRERVRVRDRERDPVRERERERDPADARTPRGKYGHVMLSDGEMRQLAADCSAGGKLCYTTPEELITTLDEYIHTKPEFKSACHLITLRGWVADKVLEQRQKARPKSASFSASDVKAYEEWGRKKLREA
ncbi:MAG: hypothetical protein J5756_04125 [Clostridia bacterium]|nr:hypothetical protein [Clostridia bacterium]